MINSLFQEQAVKGDDDSYPLSQGVVYLPLVLKQPPYRDIFFTSERDGYPAIYRMRWDGIDQIRFTTNLAQTIAPALSPNQSRIAYLAQTGVGLDLFVMNPNGSGKTQLTNVGSSISAGSFSWSPDGTQIAYSYGRGWSTIGFVSVSRLQAANKITRLTSCPPFPDNVAIPVWSPDGAWIAVTFIYYGELTIIRGEGCNIISLPNSSDRHKPQWSPDSQKLAFGLVSDTNDEIYSINVNDSVATRLTTLPSTDADPQWSPDGTTILFNSERDGNKEIYLMNADGSAQTRLTNNSAVDYSCGWSSDGKKIVFVSERDGNQEMYVMNPDGSEQTRLTNNQHRDDCV